MNYNKGFAIWGIVVIVVAVLAVGGGTYYVSVNKGEDKKVEENLNIENQVEEDGLTEKNKLEVNNNLSLYKNDDISFYYPTDWIVKTFGTKKDKNIQIIIDPIKVSSPEEMKGLDDSLGMISFSINNDSKEKNSLIIGYESFPNVIIGKEKIKAKIFEKFYPKDAPEVAAQGEHHITYYIYDNIKIEYTSEKDTYLKDFNEIIKSLSLKTSSEESTSEVFKMQPGEIKLLKPELGIRWVMSVDLLSHNPDWLPGNDSTGGFFINKNTKIRSLIATRDTKMYECGHDSDGSMNGPSVLVNPDDFINEIVKSEYKVRYFDIEGSDITAIYEQCLP